MFRYVLTILVACLVAATAAPVVAQTDMPRCREDIDRKLRTITYTARTPAQRVQEIDLELAALNILMQREVPLDQRRNVTADNVPPVMLELAYAREASNRLKAAIQANDTAATESARRDYDAARSRFQNIVNTAGDASLLRTIRDTITQNNRDPDSPEAAPVYEALERVDVADRQMLELRMAERDARVRLDSLSADDPERARVERAYYDAINNQYAVRKVTEDATALLFQRLNTFLGTSRFGASPRCPS